MFEIILKLVLAGGLGTGIFFLSMFVYDTVVERLDYRRQYNLNKSFLDKKAK